MIEDTFTHQLHMLKKQTDRKMDEAISAALALSLSEALLLLGIGNFEPISVSDLGRISSLDRSQASRITDTLEQMGLVEKTTGASDARSVLIRLTAKGRHTCGRAFSILKAGNAEILSILSVRECEAIQGAFAKLMLRSSELTLESQGRGG